MFRLVEYRHMIYNKLGTSEGRGGDRLSFAAWVRETRLRKGLQVSECAFRAGVRQPTWSEWERSPDDKTWRRATITKIAKALDVQGDRALVAARMLPQEDTDIEIGRRIGPILSQVSPKKRIEILDTLENVAEGLVKIAAI
jgi:transcriptional regulator with XRE-family HTH domain